MKLIDLHVHTGASDGTCSPAEAVALARETGLAAIAVTDHDTVSGCAEAVRAGAELGIQVVPGIEMSTRHMHRTIHILGYYPDPESPALKAALDWMIRERNTRNRRMAEKMAADGIPVSYEQMLARFGESIGRPNFGQVLTELGYAESVQDAFDRYIEKGQPYYLRREMLSIRETVETIALAGGVPVLAHPFQYRLEEAELRQLLRQCTDYGLRGMECLYSGYSRSQSAFLLALAEEYGLCPTGGSDFHGANKPHIRMGSGTGGLAVPYEYLEKLKTLAGK